MSGEGGALIESACEVMHDAYEAAAAAEGWETQERSRKPWGDVPEANKATMRSAVRALLASPALADLLAAERQRGREEVRTAVEGTTGWVPDPDAGEPYIYARDLRRALADVPAEAEGERE